MKNSILKHIILTTLVLLLFIPLIQENFSVFSIKPLEGAFTPLQKPDSLMENWFLGKFQEKYDPYFNENIGFRPFFIRLNNQIDFSLFSKLHSNDLYLGNNGYLFRPSENYSINNNDYLGEKKLIDFCENYKSIYDSLLNIGKPLLYIFAPSKTNFLKEYIPEKYLTKNFEENKNYIHIKNYFKANNIKFIDFYHYFNTIKNTNTPPLYSKGGIHWTQYGAAIALDSINKFINLNYNFTKNDFKIIGAEKKEIWIEDNDMNRILNLMFKRNELNLLYPKIHQTSKHRLKGLFITDSYYFALSWSKLNDYVFDNEETQYWYYLKSVRQANKTFPIEDVDINSTINKTDVIIILATTANLGRHPIDFISLLKSNGKSLINFTDDDILNYYQFKIKGIVNDMNKTPIWKSKLIEKAENKGVSLDSIMKLDAIWLIKNQIKNNTKELEIYRIIKKINKDSDWMKIINQKSKKNKISFYEQLYIDAKWILETDNNKQQ
jgi:hypothetical protein